MTTSLDIEALAGELARLAAAGDWLHWGEVSGYYADALLDIGDPYAGLAALPWRLHRRRKHGGAWEDLWITPLGMRAVRTGEGDIGRRRRRLFGAVNSRQLLHFAPGTLRLQDAPSNGKMSPDLPWLRWMHLASRDSGTMYDVGAHLGGFAELLAPPMRGCKA